MNKGELVPPLKLQKNETYIFDFGGKNIKAKFIYSPFRIDPINRIMYFKFEDENGNTLFKQGSSPSQLKFYKVRKGGKRSGVTRKIRKIRKATYRHRR
jgi:hypothetical protein